MASYAVGSRRASPGARRPVWPGMITQGEPRAGRARGGSPGHGSLGKRRRRGRPPRRRRPWLVTAVALGVSLSAVAVVLAYVSTAPGPRQSATVADPVLGGGPGCEPLRTPQLVRGNGTGSAASGPDAVLAFQYAYYVTRSGAQARAITTRDAVVSTAEVIDAGIASVPPDTRHCVLISPLPDGRFDVVLTEVRPDGAVKTYRQFVTVVERADGVLITRIGPPDR
ncbi:hypothetical protein IU449_24330 [Nocardia higoensis]|uniref:DUF8176 domain-containing protein n=1 Tax=Nocardia higoensis TaxID=228599 RepID=A0ABS0DGM9_9NOCA|nr:hypothetical protein [Nocardia higoensis]